MRKSEHCFLLYLLFKIYKNMTGSEQLLEVIKSDIFYLVKSVGLGGWMYVTERSDNCH